MEVKNQNNADPESKRQRNVGRPSRIQAVEKAWSELQRKEETCWVVRFERRRWQRDHRIPRHR